MCFFRETVKTASVVCKGVLDIRCKKKDKNVFSKKISGLQ